MSELAEFLLARIGEDEAEAGYESDDHSPVTNGGIEYTTAGWGGNPVLAIHPARVLAECAALRAIVEEHACCPEEGFPDDDCPHCPKVLRLLAQPYAGHPGFRDEWRVP